MRLPGIFVVVAAAFAPLAPAAQAKTIRLHWLEQTPAGFGYPVVVFNVRSIAYDGTSWRVSAAVTNRSKSPVKIRTSGTSTTIPRFGLRLPPSICKYRNYPSCLSGGAVLVPASSYTPQPPVVLDPGRRWSGAFVGRAPLREGMRIAITFGYFVAPAQHKAFSWITAHAVTL